MKGLYCMLGWAIAACALSVAQAGKPDKSGGGGKGDQAINLEQAIPFFLSAESINDSGWMVGQGYDEGGVAYPIVIVP